MRSGAVGTLGDPTAICAITVMLVVPVSGASVAVLSYAITQWLDATVDLCRGPGICGDGVALLLAVSAIAFAAIAVTVTVTVATLRIFSGPPGARGWRRALAATVWCMLAVLAGNVGCNVLILTSGSFRG